MPWIASVSSQPISGFSGFPKLRQSVKPSGSPPAQATLRAASRTASAPPTKGSSRAIRPCPSRDSARPRSEGRRRSDGSIEPGPAHRPRADELVVPAEHELATAQVRRGKQGRKGFGDPGRIRDLPLGRRRPRLEDHVVARAVVGQEARRNLSDELVVPERSQLAARGHLSDDRVAELPAVEYPLDGLDHLRSHDRDHPLLALGDHHLPRLHALLALRHPVEVHVDPVLGGHLGERRGDPRSAAVLQRLDQTGLDELDRRLDQLLPGEGVADLDRGPLLGRAVELLAREHRRPADPVAACGRTVEDDDLSAPGRLRAHDALDGKQADAHRVHEAVVAVGLVEDGLAADGRHAHRVPVRADPADSARERVPGLGEAQSVEQRDRARSHGDDVAEDPADSRRGALERLHGGRVVVALDLERDREAVAEVEDARVLSWPLEHAFPVARQPLQEQCRMLVAAVLRPEKREDRELEVVGVACEQ